MYRPSGRGGGGGQPIVVGLHYLVLLLLLLVASFRIAKCQGSQVLEFTLEPQDVVVPEGNSVLLQCSGKTQHGSHQKAGKTSPNIRWRGPDGQDLGIVGDTFRTQLKNGSLYISSVEQNRGLTGSYQCLLSVDGIGTIVSRSAIVSIARLPEINQDFMESYLLPGQTAYFRCILGHIQPGIKNDIQWLKDDAPLQIDNLRMVILQNGALEIDEIGTSDRGTYQCNVTSGVVSRLSSKTNLNIKKLTEGGESQVAPSFLVGPSPKTVKEGDTVTLDCVANGMPKPQIRWLRNGEELDLNIFPSDLDSRFSILGTGSLQISAAEDIDSGNYQCRASNTVDSLDAQATLQVQVPPKFIQSPTDKSAFEKEELELECAIRGKPKPMIHWMKNGDVITPNDYMQLVAGHNLRIMGLLQSDAGMFQCVGTNPAGSVQASARLKIITPDEDGQLTAAGNHLPGPPRDLVAQIVKPRFVAISWMEPVKNPDEVISYTVYYKMNNSEREQKIITKSHDDQQVNIQSLMPGKTYQFRVIGNSNFGPGESSEILEVRTQPEENIAGPPRSVEGYPLNHKEIYVKWEPPIVTNGIISKYRIYYAEDDSGAEMYTDSTSQSVILNELRPFTEYTITVVPFNQNGMGDPSNEMKVKTYSSSPSEPPNNVTLEVTSSTSITVHWEPPAEEERNGQITGYKIRYRKLKEAPEVKSTPANIRYFELNGLDRNSEYQVKIAAMTVNGTGPFTEWHRVVTLENDLDETQVPGKPVWIVVRTGAESIALHWGPPIQHEIKIRNFVLGWGKGIPDENILELNESERSYVLKKLEPNTEYVVSLRARNIKGDGPPIYDNIKTRDEEPMEAPMPLEVPVGLRAITMSSTSIVVYWIDTTLSKNQHVTDNRHYTVRYGITGSSRFKLHNTTDLNCMLNELRPNTQYEFAVKVVKGRRESAWSMSVLNTTLQNIPISPPREVTVRADENNPQSVIIQWLPPKHSMGQISGYNVYYTTDTSKRDRDWSIESSNLDDNVMVILNLKQHTTYYFKVQARTGKGSAPFSTLVSHTTGAAVLRQEPNTISKGLTNEMIIYMIIFGTAVILFIVVAVIVILCRKKPQSSPEHSKKSVPFSDVYSYQKNNVGVPKPPDLWIHHDQMELKNIDKPMHNHNSTPACSDGASSSGALTLPRPSLHEYDIEAPVPPCVTNSLDKRSYVPGYMTTSLNSTMERPQYPRTQYNIPNRQHMGVDTTLSQQSLSQPQNNSLAQTPEHPYMYDGFSNPPYQTAISTVETSKRGHPLKSFGTPGPPQPGVPPPVITTCSKHTPAVTIRPQNASPFKKPSFSVATPTNRLTGCSSIAHSTDEIQRLAPSTSTEELNQEMANLEGLMKDLSAITASEFEC
ncbi:neogenin isoform X4 [Eupeodes corollae]|uniref:neogenin isoform X4 n=1 Tax=Eupeodes corollae TaxID=290404 RepID=UPI00248FE6E9|nr:neogenin isoform X4 [Eupeodes corollae]